MKNKLPIKTYLLDISSIDEDLFNKLLPTVKKYRQEKINQLSTFTNKRLSLGVELLLKKACEDYEINYESLELVFGENGKPFFKNNYLFFNTAHSGKYAICVISDKEVGIDIEEIEDYKEKVAERYFTLNEKKYIELSNNKEEMFYRIWTLKEAYTKCIGKGLMIPFNSFELTTKDSDIFVDKNENYQFYEEVVSNHRIAWCVKTSKEEKEKYFSTISILSLK